MPNENPNPQVQHIESIAETDIRPAIMDNCDNIRKARACKSATEKSLEVLEQLFRSMPATINDSEEVQKRRANLQDVKIHLTLVDATLQAMDINHIQISGHLDNSYDDLHEIAGTLEHQKSTICTENYTLSVGEPMGDGDLWLKNNEGEGMVMELHQLDKMLGEHMSSHF